LVGPQALNPYFSKKKLFDLNESFFKILKNQSINYKLTHEDFSLERTDWLAPGETVSPIIPLENKSFMGFEVYLGDLYFDPLLDPLRNAQTSYLKSKKKCFFDAILEYHTELVKYNPKSRISNFKNHKNTPLLTKTIGVLKKDTLYFKYGLDVL
jgi:hypothetical protein